MSKLVWLKEVTRVIKTPKSLFSKIRLGLGLPDATSFIRQPDNVGRYLVFYCERALGNST